MGNRLWLSGVSLMLATLVLGISPATAQYDDNPGYNEAYYNEDVADSSYSFYDALHSYDSGYNYRAGRGMGYGTDYALDRYDYDYDYIGDLDDDDYGYFDDGYADDDWFYDYYDRYDYDGDYYDSDAYESDEVWGDDWSEYEPAHYSPFTGYDDAGEEGLFDW